MHPRFNILLALSSLLVSLSTITTALAADIAKPPILGPITKGLSLKAVGTTTPTPYGGIEAKGWVMLSAPASIAIHVVLVPSNSQLVEYPFPQGVQLSVGQTVGNFAFRPKPVTAPTQLVVTARIGQQQESKTINYTVLPPVLLSMSLNATNVVGGGVVQGTATFSGLPAAAGSLWAKLSSSNPSVGTVSAKAVLEVGKTVAAFEIKTLGVSNDTPVTISASTGSTYPTTGSAMPHATLKVLPAALKEVIGPYANPQSIGCTGPCSGELILNLTGLAPPEGAVVKLTSSKPSLVSVPDTVTVPAQQVKTSATFTVPVATSSTTTASVSASYRGVIKTAGVTVRAWVKPDLIIKSVSLYDRFNNPITKPQDSQPFKMCITVKGNGDDGPWPSQMPSPSLLRIGYRKPSSGGTSVGRDWEISIVFGIVAAGGDYNTARPCTGNTDMPGLEVGQYYDVTLQADVKNQVDERKEGNNSYGPVRISR